MSAATHAVWPVPHIPPPPPDGAMHKALGRLEAAVGEAGEAVARLRDLLRLRRPTLLALVLLALPLSRTPTR
jgi:Flp pilus assembly protein TadD